MSLYSENSIRKAIDAFDGLCHITAIKDGDYVQCTFSNCRFELMETMREFENYLIDLMNCAL